MFDNDEYETDVLTRDRAARRKQVSRFHGPRDSEYPDPPEDDDEQTDIENADDR